VSSRYATVLCDRRLPPRGAGTPSASSIAEARKRTDAQIDETLQAAYAADTKLDRDLREALSDVLAGNVGERVAGAVVLFFGIVLGTAGSVLGNLG
jgi:hypothetical protein